MTAVYPIVHQRTLDAAARRNRFRRRERSDVDLPRAEAHQVLVYRVNGQYVLDNARLRGHDEEVVDATAVSVVDMTRDAPVLVQLAVPSCEASDFVVQVVFAATVIDPVQVVREGVRAVVSLENYLRSHHKLFELGLSYVMRDINEVRRDMNAQITAFTTVRQPRIPGLAVRMASVQVSTPDELRAHAEKLRRQKWDHELGMDREHQGQDLARAQNRYQQDHEYDQFQHEGLIETERARRDRQHQAEAARFAQAAEVDQARHTLHVEAERREFERLELTKAAELIGSDPRQALRMAFAAGQIDASTLADRLGAASTGDREIEERRHQERRDDERRSQAWDRQDRAAALEAYREEQRALTERAHQEAAESRADKQKWQEWARDDQRQFAEATRADQHRQFTANIEILRELAKRGHLDTLNVNVERLIAGISGDGRAALETEQPKALDEAVGEAAAGPAAEDRDGPDDVENTDIKEEDDYR